MSKKKSFSTLRRADTANSILMNIVMAEGKSADQTAPPDFVYTFWIFRQIIKRLIKTRCTMHLGIRGVFLVLPSPQASYTTNHNRKNKELVGGWRFRG